MKVSAAFFSKYRACSPTHASSHSQVQRERDLLLARVESMDAELQRERGLHRRELRKKAKDVQEVCWTLHRELLRFL